MHDSGEANKYNSASFAATDHVADTPFIHSKRGSKT